MGLFKVLLLLYLWVVMILSRPRNEKINSAAHKDQDELNGELNTAIEDSFSWADIFTAVQNLPQPPASVESVIEERSPSSPLLTQIKERDGHENEFNVKKLGVGFQVHKDICGTRPGKKETRGTRRIIGGEQAEIGEFPWQVSLMRIASKVAEKPVLTCGGALVSTRSVLTACHCLKLPANRYEVWVGRISSIVDVKECHDQKFHVVEYFKHPNFDPDTLQNDVAVLSISSKYNQGVRWNDLVLPICLPHPHHHNRLYIPNTDGIVAGWGLLKEEDKYMSSNLQHVKVPIISLTNCNIAYNGLTTLIESQLCAGGKDGGRDACAGDSGGPLVVKDTSTGRFYQAGIVSFGMGCGRREYPGVYSKVSSFTQWVFDTVKNIQQGGPESPHLVIEPVDTTTLIPFTSTGHPETTKLITTRLVSTTVSTTTRKPSTTASPPIIHDLGPVCRGHYKWAICGRRGYVIKVISGSYGRPASSSECAGLLVPWWMRRRECSLRSAGAELARACNGKKKCRISAREGKNNIFLRNPCMRQRPFVTLRYICEAERGTMQRSFSEYEEDIFIEDEEGIDYYDIEGFDDEKYTNYV